MVKEKKKNVTSNAKHLIGKYIKIYAISFSLLRKFRKPYSMWKKLFILLSPPQEFAISTSKPNDYHTKISKTPSSFFLITSHLVTLSISPEKAKGVVPEILISQEWDGESKKKKKSSTAIRK